MEKQSKTGAAFPEAGGDRLATALRLRITDGGNSKIDEIVTMPTVIAFRRGDPYVNEEGLRQIDLDILAWRGKAFSRALQESIEFNLSDARQPTSTITSDRLKSDFPYTITFNVLFDATVGAVELKALEGRAVGSGLNELPPDGTDILTVEKPKMRVGNIEIFAEACASMPIPEHILELRL